MSSLKLGDSIAFSLLLPSPLPFSLPLPPLSSLLLSSSPLHPLHLSSKLKLLLTALHLCNKAKYRFTEYNVLCIQIICCIYPPPKNLHAQYDYLIVLMALGQIIYSPLS